MKRVPFPLKRTKESGLDGAQEYQLGNKIKRVAVGCGVADQRRQLRKKICHGRPPEVHRELDILSLFSLQCSWVPCSDRFLDPQGSV